METAIKPHADETPTNPAVLKYQQRCFTEYAASIGLPKNYMYPDGNPIRPLPPLQTAIGGLMIVGAYPSARFESRPSATDPTRRRLIPIADNLHPFAKEEYFDGLRVRRLESGKQIRTHLFGPLGLDAEQCWITDLVKVFLYKPEHVDSCGEAVPQFQARELRSHLFDFGRKSLSWLKDECNICRPKIIVTLGEEVAQVVLNERQAKADDLLNRPLAPSADLGGYPLLCLPHPDACRRSAKWRDNIESRLHVVGDMLH